MTAPNKSAFNVRLSDDHIAALDERAKQAGLSRNAWIERATWWCLTQLPLGVDGEARRRAAMSAPAEVAGESPFDLVKPL